MASKGWIAMGLLAALATTPAQAQSGGAVAVGRVTVTILKPITVEAKTEMEFGMVTPAQSQSGSVTLDFADGDRHCSAGMTCQGPFSLADFLIRASNGVVMVSYHNVHQLTGPGAPMQIEIDAGGGAPATVNISDEKAVLRFGATLTVPQGQTPGVYAGSFAIEVAYQ
jgi:hypothetical protein